MVKKKQSSIVYNTRSKALPFSIKKELKKALKKLSVKNSSNRKVIRIDLPQNPHIKRKGFKRGSKGKTFYIDFVAPSKKDNESNIKEYLERTNSLNTNTSKTPPETPLDALKDQPLSGPPQTREEKHEREEKKQIKKELEELLAPGKDDDPKNYIYLEFGTDGKCNFKINSYALENLYGLKVIRRHDEFSGYFDATVNIGENHNENRLLKISAYEKGYSADFEIPTCGYQLDIQFDNINGFDKNKFVPVIKSFRIQAESKESKESKNFMVKIDVLKGDFELMTGDQLSKGAKTFKKYETFTNYLKTKSLAVKTAKEFAYYENDNINPIKIINSGSVFLKNFVDSG